ncbi:hypothetical protein [Treponema sp.]|uniref:hypothetical protein n=1 Tax=Treponema sp. TaxID=166 RepID=UPI0025FDF343|nr:hypothetical protein [Treponema sp.]MCR5218420.1 hypothetical protein [Treponema sp.]
MLIKTFSITQNMEAQSGYGSDKYTAGATEHGAFLAKGRLTGLQFDTFFTDDLYFKPGKLL